MNGLMIDRKEIGGPGAFEGMSDDDIRARIAARLAKLGFSAPEPRQIIDAATVESEPERAAVTRVRRRQLPVTYTQRLFSQPRPDLRPSLNFRHPTEPGVPAPGKGGCGSGVVNSSPPTHRPDFSANRSHLLAKAARPKICSEIGIVLPEF